MRTNLTACLSVSIILFSCVQKNNTDTIAKVGDVELNKTLLLQSMPQGLKGNDSLEWCNQWVENWVLEQLLLEKIEEIEEPADIDEKTNIYRNQLLIQALKEKVITEQFDPQSIKIDPSKMDTLSAVGSREMALEMKKMEIWQNYQNQLMKQALETGKWKK